MASLKSWRSSPTSTARRDGPDEADAQAVEHAAPRELDGQVQRGLAAHGRQHRVRPLALQDRFSTTSGVSGSM